MNLLPAPRFVTRILPLLAVLTGLALAQGLAPSGLWGATLVSVLAAGGLFLWTEQDVVPGRKVWRHAAFVGWCLGFGYFVWGLRWIVEPFQVDVDTHGWMAPFALVFMAGGLALFWGRGLWACAGADAKRRAVGAGWDLVFGGIGAGLCSDRFSLGRFGPGRAA